MLQPPLKLVQTLRPNIPAGILLATAVSTVVFTATPFLIPVIADDRNVSVGSVGIISTAQLGGFVLASWLAPRWFRPRRKMMAAAIVIGVVSNLLSGFSPWFGMLVAMRLVSGVSLGLIAWISWTEVFGDDERVGDVAVIGPIVGTVASPVIASFLDVAGPDWLYFALAAIHVLPALAIRSMRLQAGKRAVHAKHRPTRAAVAILVCLGLLTFGGSAAFVFAAAIGTEHVGLSAFAMSLVFAANALAGVPSARFRGGRSLPGAWMVVTGVCALLVGAVHVLPVYLIAMPLWGFAFWMGIPGAFSLLAERSAYPEERAGDAQSVMAAGRVFGPVVGGVLYEADPVVLGVVAGGVMIAAAVLLLYVEWRIHPYVLESFTTRTA
jgi:DHA1 family purine base/nucleoside efflux pump-like MFS transporter